MTGWKTFCTCIAAAALISGASAQVSDAPDDFLPSFTGPHDADLDALQANVIIDSEAQTALLTGTLRGPLDANSNAVYVWILDRGAGEPIFFQSGNPRIAPFIFGDVLVAAFPLGVGSVIDLASDESQSIPLGSIQVEGDTISVLLPLSMLPSRGLLPERYAFTFSPWFGSGANTQIADFVPDETNALVDVTFECPGDTDRNRVADLNDLLRVLANFGAPGGASRGAGDLDGDRDIDLDDLLLVLANFGRACP